MRKNSRYLLATLLLFVLTHQGVFCSTSPSQTSTPTLEVSLLRDAGHTYTWPEVLSKKSQFVASSRPTHTSPFDAATYWIMITPKVDDTGPWVLECTNHLLDTLELYHPHKGLIFQTGMMIPMADRPMQGTSLALPLDAALASDTLYLRTRSETLSEVPLRVLSEEDYLQGQISKYVFYGIVIGIILLFALHSLIVFFMRKQRLYLLLFVYTLLSVLINAHFGGLSFFWYPAWWLQYGILFLVDATFFLILAYSFSILRIKETFPKLYLYLRWFYLLPIIMVCLPLVASGSIVTLIHNVVPQPILIFFGLLGLISWRRGNTNALFYSLAWFFHFAFLFPYMLSNFGVLPTNIFTGNSPAIGIMIEL